MQIYELTKPQLDEAIGSTLGGLVGRARAGASALGQKIAGGGAYAAARDEQIRAQQMSTVSNKAQQAWNNYTKELAQTQTVTPQQLLINLRAFVQKNFLGDLKYQYDNLTNKAQIEALLADIVDPKNAGTQKALWDRLIKTITVALPGGSAATPAAKKSKSGSATQTGLSAQANPQEIMTAIVNSGIPVNNYRNMSTILKNVAGTATINSTGNSAMDAFLKSLGFGIQ
jgi:hypothetical protein